MEGKEKTMKTRNREKRPLPQVSEHDRVTQFAFLREFLNIQKSRPFMGEHAAALLRMLDAGQITCEYIRRRSKKRMVLAASVSPQEIEALVPLVKHPTCYVGFRFFLERLGYIAALQGDEEELEYLDSDQLLALPYAEPTKLGDLYRSGVADPPLIWRGFARISAEQTVAAALDLPCSYAPDGWIVLNVGDHSVGVQPIESPDTPLAFPNPTAFIKDIVVLTFHDREAQATKVIGWANKELFLKNHRRIESEGIVQCVLDQEHLFPFDSLIKLAREKPVGKV
jgi:hypothetical protein